MASETSLSHQLFLRMAAEAGLDIQSPHMDDLYAYTSGVLDGLRSLQNLDVSGAEPDMAFMPSPE